MIHCIITILLSPIAPKVKPHPIRIPVIRAQHQPAETVPRHSSTTSVLDGLAVCASTICMVHCLLLPVLLAALPALATWFDPGESFHRLVLAFAVPTSAMALVGGWRVHRAVPPVVLGIAGLMLMTIGVVIAGHPLLETDVSVAGSLMLAFAHIANWRNRLARTVA